MLPFLRTNAEKSVRSDSKICRTPFYFVERSRVSSFFVDFCRLLFSAKIAACFSLRCKNFFSIALSPNIFANSATVKIRRKTKINDFRVLPLIIATSVKNVSRIGNRDFSDFRAIVSNYFF